jgi:hypothetical protein
MKARTRSCAAVARQILSGDSPALVLPAGHGTCYTKAEDAIKKHAASLLVATDEQYFGSVREWYDMFETTVNG